MYDHVLVGTDGSTTATAAVERAARVAQVHRAHLTIAHAFDPREPPSPETDALEAEFPWLRTSGGRAESLVNAAVDRAQAAACGSLSVTGRMAPGRPVGVLLSLIDELGPDAVIVGNADVHRVGIPRSVGQALTRRARSDVIIVDTKGAQQPAASHATTDH